MPVRLFIAGHTGRLGSEVARLASQHGMALSDTLHDATAVAVALPRASAPALIEAAGERTVVDLSGHLKGQPGARYALLTSEGVLWDGSPPRPGDRLANPGCIASSVILGLHRTRILDVLEGPLHITAVGGRSMAARGQEGELRLARRLGKSHPHAAEIEAATGATVASFSPIVAYAQPRGIMSVISGRWSGPPGGIALDAPRDLEVASVVGTPEVLTRLSSHGSSFTLGVALDNLTFPAWNAVQVLLTSN